jgi:hypothetical protein
LIVHAVEREDQAARVQRTTVKVKLGAGAIESPAKGVRAMEIVIKSIREPFGAYRAWCPALPGCEVWGLSRRQAVKKANVAVEEYMANMDTVLPRELDRLMNSTSWHAPARAARPFAAKAS